MDLGPLLKLLMAERGTLLHYVRDTVPTFSAVGDARLTRVLELADQEDRALTSLAKLLLKHRQRVPFNTSYPAAYTSENFVTVESLLPKLVQEQGAGLSATEALLARTTDAQTRLVLCDYVTHKRQRLAALRELSPAPNVP